MKKAHKSNSPISFCTSSRAISSIVKKTEVQLELRKQSTMRPKQSRVELSGKARAWKTSEANPVLDSGPRYGSMKNFDGNRRSLSVDASDGIKKCPVLVEGNRRDSVQLRKVKSAVVKEKSGSNKICDEPRSLKRSVSLQKVDSNESVRGEEDFGECEEKEITSNLVTVGGFRVQCDQDLRNLDNDDDDGEENELDDKLEEEIEVEIEEKSVDIAKAVQFSPFVDLDKVHSVTQPENLHATSCTNSKLQSFVDLIMWKDVSKTTLVFGVGTFFIVSSSYTSDLNISFVSVVAYLGLVYLASVFFFRSFINRGSTDVKIRQHDDYVVGEEEAIWVVNLILPYVNVFLSKFRALFSGDPATTMKLAVLLFVLARSGSSITIWKMTKLGFFSVFTVPKICSSYSSKLTAFGTFWIRRFRDAWDSCSHKKAVGFCIFTLVWNLSSPVARIWAAFMLLVAFKYYQQSLIREGLTNQEAGMDRSSGGLGIGDQEHVFKITLPDSRKQK